MANVSEPVSSVSGEFASHISEFIAQPMTANFLNSDLTDLDLAFAASGSGRLVNTPSLNLKAIQK